MATKVRRALEYGLQSGLIKHLRGKYSLGLNKHDFAICKKFTDPNSDSNASRRQGRRGRRRRSRSRRRRTKKRSRYSRLSTEIDVDENTESNRRITDTPEPVERCKGRRGRKRRGQRRTRRSKRGRSRLMADGIYSGTPNGSYKGWKTAVSPEKKYSDQEKAEDRNIWKRNNQERAQDDDGEYGCPSCFCNIKQGDECPRCMSREDTTYYNESYLN